MLVDPAELAELRAQRDRYRDLVEQSPVAVAVYVDFVFVYANPAAAAIYGARDVDDLVGRNLRDMVGEQAWPAVLARAERILSGERVLGERAPLRRLDGTSLVVEVNAVRVEYEGRPGVQVELRDADRFVAAEDELRASQERWRTVFDASPVGMIETDAAGVILAVNPSLARMLGGVPAAFVGRRVPDLIHADNPADVHGPLADLGAGRVRAHQVQRLFRHEDGSAVPVHVSAAPVRDDAGQVVRLLATVLDQRDLHAVQSDLLAAHAELEARTALTDALVETVDVGIIACDVTGTITRTNRLAREHSGGVSGTVGDDFGTAGDDLGGSGDHLGGDAVGEDRGGSAPGEDRGEDRGSPWPLFRADGITPLPFEEVPLRRALLDGELKDARVVIAPEGLPARHLLVHGRRLTGPDGAVLGAVIATHDVTALHERTQELAGEREVQAQLLAGLSDLGEGVIVGEGARVVYVNEAYAAYSGYTVQELLDLPDSTVLFEPEFAAQWPERVRRLAAGDREVQHVRAGLRRKDGGVMPMEGWTKPVRIQGRQQRISVVRDVTAELAAERALGEQHDALGAANRDLTAANADLAVFAAAAAHDLKNPLGSIAGFAQLMHDYDDALDDRGRSMLARIEQAATRMASLIDDLLAYASAGTVALALRPVDLDELAARVVADLADTIEATGAHVDIDALPRVLADATLVRQLLTNLLGNALKYTRPGEPPRVRLDAVTHSRGTLVRVSDAGIGIPTAQQEQVFAPFTRLADARAYPGTGLGLALCRRIVDRHGGRIGVTTASPRGGSCFWFTLAPAPQTATTNAATAAIRAVDPSTTTPPSAQTPRPARPLRHAP